MSPADPGRPPSAAAVLTVEPLTCERLGDFEALFGPRGACGGCWCMWWRLSASEFRRQRGEGNRKAMRALVAGGEVPGLLAYLDGEPVGWCCVGPRTAFPRLARSRVLAAVDEAPVWSVVCFFVARRARRQGVMGKLLEGAVAHACRAGAQMVEGYPVAPRQRVTADAFAFTGLLGPFLAAGFVEVARRSPTRPIVRRPTARVATEDLRPLGRT